LMSRYRSHIESAGGSFVCAEQLPSICGEPIQIEIVLQNLVENAIKYAAPHRPLVLSIETVNHPDTMPGYTCLCVRDNGIGISSPHRDRVFDMFYQINSDREKRSHGMGLAFSKTIINRHGGAIWVESEEGRGSAFFFTLPVPLEKS